VWRVHAGGRSAVLKLLRLNAGPHEQWPSRPGPDDPYYWLREPLAYESRALEPFGVPRLLGRVDRPDGDVALWLEDGGDPLETWTPDLLAAAAHRLGAAQRQLLGFDAPWLAHGWLREYFRLHELPYDDGFDELPQTLCHNDFHPTNVLDSGLLIDWAFCGVGPIGMDAGVLVGDGLADKRYPPEQVDEVFEAVWRGYSDGFGSADDQVRYGFVHGILRLRWLVRGRLPEWDATIDFMERLASRG
jgi:Phosphotransferase enzyme family